MIFSFCYVANKLLKTQFTCSTLKLGIRVCYTKYNSPDLIHIYKEAKRRKGTLLK